MAEVTITTYVEARETFRQKHLRQALYDAGEVVMADVLVNLHSDDHRARRRLENRLFRKDTQISFERELFPPIVEETLAPHVAVGGAELVSLSHQMMMNLAAFAAGVDRPNRTEEETLHLYSYLMTFIEGATLAHYTGDHEAKKTEVRAAQDQFTEEFLNPSISRRTKAILDVERGDLPEAELPSDILTVLLQNQGNLELDPDVVMREVCFYLLAGAHTSATAFVRTLNNLFNGPEEQLLRAGSDRGYLQSCVHETIRLQPSSPVAMRWALQDIELSSGEHIQEGDRVTIDLMSVNRDPNIFGEQADDFRPGREVATGGASAGLSFGLGMHHCIGAELAAGSDVLGEMDSDHIYGLVPVALEAALNAGCRADPDHPAKLDPESERGYWSSYPVIFGDAGSAGQD